MKYNKDNWETSFIVTPTKNNIVGITNTVNKVKSKDGYKYCFTVPSGYFIARRNGKIFITGNCGMTVVNMKKRCPDLKELDDFIRESIPHGFNTHSTQQAVGNLSLKKLHCYNEVNIDRALKSIGTLGGGNHFIEVDKASNGDHYLVIHSGSRNIGKQVADYYQNMAYENCNLLKPRIDATIAHLKKTGKSKEIDKEIKKIKRESPIVPKALSYLEGKGFEMYMHDMKIIQEYASYNREQMAYAIMSRFGISPSEEDVFETIHNYIDMDSMILRKGAVSAKAGEKLIIPMNMRDGCIVAVGKGNENWNQSAPHGAGRIMSRGKAKEMISLEEFEESMDGIYSTSVKQSTIDESPMTYKPMQEIIENIKDTVEILEIVKPIYNFKA